MSSFLIDRSLAPKPGSKEENQILERRLTLQESSVGKPSLTKITDKFKYYLNNCNSNETDDDKKKREYAFQDVMREVALYDLEMQKQEAQYEACKNYEIHHYKKIADEIQATITYIIETEQIELEETLSNSIKIRKHRELIEEYASEIQLLPNITKLDKELDGLVRKKPFVVVVVVVVVYSYLCP